MMKFDAGMRGTFSGAPGSEARPAETSHDSGLIPDGFSILYSTPPDQQPNTRLSINLQFTIFVRTISTFLIAEDLKMALSFASDIRPLFRDTPDVDTMKRIGLDLSSYADVKEQAAAIHARLEDGSM